MKKVTVLCLFLSLFLIINSCTVEPYEGPLPNNGVRSFKCDFDGQTFVAATTQAIVNSSYIAITGIGGAGNFFQITIPSGTVGTYTLANAPSNFAMIYSSGNNQIPYLAASDNTGEFADFPEYVDTAEIKITEINTVSKLISGTFKFTGVKFQSGSSTAISTKVFTNGVFTNIPYTSNNVSPATNNSFSAKIDGAAFVPTNINGVKMSGNIAIVGRKGAVENIGLFIPENTITGTTINFTALGSNGRGQYVSGMNASDIFGGDGSMIISLHDTANKRIKGTFVFTAKTVLAPILTREITEGTFDVTYQ